MFYIISFCPKKDLWDVYNPKERAFKVSKGLKFTGGNNNKTVMLYMKFHQNPETTKPK
jgi:hypothetical protein